MELGLQIVSASLWVIILVGWLVAFSRYLWSSLHNRYGVNWIDIALGIFGVIVALLGICSVIVWIIVLIGGK